MARDAGGREGRGKMSGVSEGGRERHGLGMLWRVIRKNGAKSGSMVKKEDRRKLLGIRTSSCACTYNGKHRQQAVLVCCCPLVPLFWCLQCRRKPRDCRVACARNRTQCDWRLAVIGAVSGSKRVMTLCSCIHPDGDDGDIGSSDPRQRPKDAVWQKKVRSLSSTRTRGVTRETEIASVGRAFESGTSMADYESTHLASYSVSYPPKEVATPVTRLLKDLWLLRCVKSEV